MMVPRMREVLYYWLFLITVAKGSTDTECIISTRGTLVCKFPDNMNSTQRDFGVYFYPDDGGEEPLVDCAWIRSKFHCIQQKDFECQPPVSHTAKITIPSNYMGKNGSYRCVPDGYSHDNIKSCRFTDKEDNEYLSLCEARAVSEDETLVKCNFSFMVESFTVLQKTTVAASFTKSVCHNSSTCDYKVINNHDVFTVYLGLKKYFSNKYSCHPNSSQEVDIKVCLAYDEAHNEGVGTSLNPPSMAIANFGLRVLVYATVAFLFIVILIAALCIVIRPRGMTKYKTGDNKKVIQSHLAYLSVSRV